MSVLHFDPFRDAERLTDQMLLARLRGAPRSIPIDVYQRGDRLVIHCDLPGVDAEAIELTVEQNVLTVKAERRYEAEEGDDILVNERPEGTFSRQLIVGESFDIHRLEANYDQGVLTITIPIAASARPRRVPITKSGGHTRIVESQPSEPSEPNRTSEPPSG